MNLNERKTISRSLTKKKIFHWYFRHNILVGVRAKVCLDLNNLAFSFFFSHSLCLSTSSFSDFCFVCICCESDA